MKLELFTVRDGEVFRRHQGKAKVSALKTSPVFVNLPYDIDYRSDEKVAEDVREQIRPHLSELSRFNGTGFAIGMGHQLGRHVREGVIYPVQLYVGRRK